MAETTPDPSLSDLDRDLLNAVQWDFPLTARPFAALGERLGKIVIIYGHHLIENPLIGPSGHPKKFAPIAKVGPHSAATEVLEVVLTDIRPNDASQVALQSLDVFALPSPHRVRNPFEHGIRSALGHTSNGRPTHRVRDGGDSILDSTHYTSSVDGEDRR